MLLESNQVTRIKGKKPFFTQVLEKTDFLTARNSGSSNDFVVVVVVGVVVGVGVVLVVLVGLYLHKPRV